MVLIWISKPSFKPRKTRKLEHSHLSSSSLYLNGLAISSLSLSLSPSSRCPSSLLAPAKRAKAEVAAFLRPSVPLLSSLRLHFLSFFLFSSGRGATVQEPAGAVCLCSYSVDCSSANATTSINQILDRNTTCSGEATPLNSSPLLLGFGRTTKSSSIQARITGVSSGNRWGEQH